MAKVNFSEMRTVDFIPAPSGWRIGYFADDGSQFTEDLAGWLVEEEYRDRNGSLIPAECRDRTITAASHEALSPWPLSWDQNACGPYGPSMTDEEIHKAVEFERTCRSAALEYERSRREKAKANEA